MPVLVDLLPAQMIRFAQLAEELDRNGFEAEPFGPRTLAIKAAPVGLEGRELELTLEDLLSTPDPEQQTENAGTRPAASPPPSPATPPSRSTPPSTPPKSPGSSKPSAKPNTPPPAPTAAP